MPLWQMRQEMHGQNSWLFVLGTCQRGEVKERFLALTEIKSFDAQRAAAADPEEKCSRT